MGKVQEFQMRLSPEVAFTPELLEQEIASKTKMSPELGFRVVRRSIDARGRKVMVNLAVQIALKPDLEEIISYSTDNLPNVESAKPVIVVGAGPAGLFAALQLIELGLKPIVVERGKDVQARRRDLAAINKEHIVNPESNYCFGEGGAGTYSDGKLYTRSIKRGNVRRVLEILVAHGATTDILIDAHPHIGTNKLPKIIAAIRNTIIEHGGEVRFNAKVTDFLIQNNHIEGVVLADGEKVAGKGVILATGHSARDIFYLLQEKGIQIEGKPFALGVRIEHQQQLIDKIQYSCELRPDVLPAASYSLVHQTLYKGIQRGVFSFCMCPGGFIVPAATAPGEVVVNGMSPSRRDSKFANSGIVVAVEPEDLKPFRKYGELAGLRFQQEVEQQACKVAGSTQQAPAQRLADFIDKKVSGSLLPTSYQPGLASSNMDEVLPADVAYRLREGFKAFDKKMRGYMTNEAQIVGVESRTSSPVRIPRDADNLQHPQIKGLYPCGEGAGYAGGIASAAMDGERCALMAAAVVAGH